MNKLDLEIKKFLGSTDPLIILQKWLKEAQKINTKEPWAMVLSTSHKKKTSSRVVLLKELHQGKILFYTNYFSSKGREMDKNPLVAANFYWPQLDRQIRIEGETQKTSRKKSVQYWKTRCRDSQISQWISRQSQGVSSRREMEELKKSAEQKFYDKKIPCPKHWGGYALCIKRIEFWKNRTHRLHDRFLFEKNTEGWTKQRLFP